MNAKIKYTHLETTRTESELVDDGWRRCFVSDEPRLSDVVDTYLEMEYEVVLRPLMFPAEEVSAQVGSNPESENTPRYETCREPDERKEPNESSGPDESRGLDESSEPDEPGSCNLQRGMPSDPDRCTICIQADPERFRVIFVRKSQHRGNAVDTDLPGRG